MFWAGDCVGRVTPSTVVIYGIEDTRGRVRYVGWTGDLTRRMREHWKRRNSAVRTRENPRFHAWLGGQLFPPSARVLQIVPYSQRYAAERSWSITMAAKHPLLNVSYGAAPLPRGPLSAEHRAKISLALIERNRHRGGPPRAVTALLSRAMAGDGEAPVIRPCAVPSA